MKAWHPNLILGEFGPWVAEPLEDRDDPSFYQMTCDSRVHKTADINPQCVIYNNVRIWAFTTICKDVVLDNNVVVGGRCFIGAGTVVRENTRIQDGVFIPKKTMIGRNVFIGPNVVMTDDKYPMVNNPNYHAEPPIILDNVSIGAGVIICPGVIINENSIIAAGTVITKDVPKNSIIRNELTLVREDNRHG